MASIRKRNGLWQAQVRSRKFGSTSKSFHKKADAIAWAKVQEAMMQTGEWKPKDKLEAQRDAAKVGRRVLAQLRRIEAQISLKGNKNQ